MVTQKATETIWGVMHGQSAVVELGRGHSGKPTVAVSLPTGHGTTELAFNNAIILRDVAGDLLAAARYIEDENEKAGL